jgi:isocitrate dehydrogenase
VSIEDLGLKTGNTGAVAVAQALDVANGRVLDNDRSPQRKVGEIDNRGSHFYLAQYWARALADQASDAGLKATFTPVAAALESQEPAILGELNGVQGKPVEIGGYYHPDPARCSAAMRPSRTLNAIVDALRA